MRGVALALLACLAALPARAAEITAAQYAEPTTRYAHGILGDAVEWGALQLTTLACATCAPQNTVIRLPETRVFEDTAPRLVTFENGGPTLVMVVESDLKLGARLALYDDTGPVAATPFIGQPNRWLAPIGAADLDGDGYVEIGYIDRPHLAKTLRLWRFRDGKLTDIGSLDGLTNHRIGEDTIAGGIRTCAGRPEMIVASADWRRLIAVTFDSGTLAPRDIGPHRNRASFARALACS